MCLCGERQDEHKQNSLYIVFRHPFVHQDLHIHAAATARHPASVNYSSSLMLDPEVVVPSSLQVNPQC
jgi:hypothetical protein